MIRNTKANISGTSTTVKKSGMMDTRLEKSLNQ